MIAVGVCEVFDFGDVVEEKFMKIFETNGGSECMNRLRLMHPLCLE